MSFFDKIAHLFQNDAPKLEMLIQPEIDMLTSLLNKFAALDLSSASNAVLSAVTAGTPIGNAVSTGAVAIKSTALTQGIAILDDEANLISQALTKNTVASVNSAVQPPKTEEIK